MYLVKRAFFVNDKCEA